MKFGENLQKLRKEKGLSQEQLAEKLGVTRQSVSKWESGASYPEMDKIVSLCNMFHCDLDVLINKDVTEERQRKDASSIVKSLFQGASDYVKKTIYLFEHKSIKELIKICSQIIIIVLVILCFSIPFMLLKEIVVDLFYTGDNWFSLFFSKFWGFLFNASYAILAIITFLYIFKVKFLDGEEIIVEEVEEDSSEDKEEESHASLENKKTKVVRVKHHNDFSLLDLFSKAITVCIKGILLFMLIPAVVGVIMLIIGLVLLIVLIFKGLLLMGPILFVLGISVFSIVVIELILDFIFNLKFSKRRVIITILSSIVVSAIGLGLSIWYFLNLNIVSDVPSRFKSATVEEDYTMNDNFFVYYYDYGYTKFVYDESYSDKVRVRVDYYPLTNDVSLAQDDDGVYLDFDVVRGVNLKEITDSVIDDLKNGEIHTYDKLNQVTMTITSSKANIDKMKDNYQKYLDIEEGY